MSPSNPSLPSTHLNRGLLSDSWETPGTEQAPRLLCSRLLYPPTTSIPQIQEDNRPLSLFIFCSVVCLIVLYTLSLLTVRLLILSYYPVSTDPWCFRLSVLPRSSPFYSLYRLPCRSLSGPTPGRAPPTLGPFVYTDLGK